MLFWLILAVFVIGTIVIFNTSDYTMSNFAGGIAMALGFIGLLGSLAFFVINYCGVDGYIAKNQKLREMLVYQLENDNELGKFELMEKITDWNTDLAANRELQDSFWLGIYVPDIYDQFEFIDVEGFE